MKKYKCVVCGYIYDPEIGETEGKVDAGTAFENINDEWECPVCGASKDEFDEED